MKNAIRTYTCIGCGKVVTKSCVKKVKFCNPQCYHENKGRLGLMPKRGQTKKCLECGNKFYVPKCRSGAKFCSTQCHNENQSQKVDIECSICGKIKSVSPVFLDRKYCSIKCRDKDPENKKRLLAMRVKQQKKNPNKFETSCYKYLDENGIDYIPQYVIGNKFCVDAFIEDENIAIQFDGDYWHGNPKKYTDLDKRQRKRVALDKSQDAYMKACGIKVVRVWQSEFKKDKSTLIKRFKQVTAQRALF